MVQIEDLPKLSDEPLDFPAVGWHVIDAPPIVCFHREVTKGDESEDGTPSVADEDIEDPVVPPAL